jgi:Uma2 family endonuclease
VALDPQFARRPITVGEFLRMGEVGILNPYDRVELIEGELIAMAPIGANHAGTVIALNDALTAAARGRALVSPQNPVQ